MKKLLALGLLGLICGYALAQTNPAPATPTPANPAQATPPTESATIGVAGARIESYTDSIPPEQLVALDANGDKFQARHIPDLSGLPRGAVIILHDSGQHPSWPFTAAALIDDLPLHGWDALNIELPAPASDSAKSETPAPAATPPAANTAAPATGANTTAPAAAAATATSIEPQVQARINAAIKYYSDQNQTNIVLIGFGSGAIRAAENLRLLATVNTAKPGAAAPPTTAPITALVMIAPQQQLNGIDMDLPKLLPLTEIPALDLALDNDTLARTDAEARRRAVLHQRARIYTRLELAPINNASNAQHSVMVKRVRSWLQVNAQAAR